MVVGTLRAQYDWFAVKLLLVERFWYTVSSTNKIEHCVARKEKK